MHDFLSRNKWVLLATVSLTLVGISMLVGRALNEDDLSQSDAVATQQQAQNVPANLAPLSPAASEQEATSDDGDQTYADDDELIENPEGYDPSPPEEQSDHDAHSGGDPAPSDTQTDNGSQDNSASSDDSGE